MKYKVALKTIVIREVEADTVEEAVDEAKESAAWYYFNEPADWDLIMVERKGV